VGTSDVPAEPGELERLLGRAGAEADAMWLDGFMTGCELAPEPTSHEAWAQDLIRHGDIRQDRDAMHRLLDLALQRYETLLEALNEPDAIHDSVDAVSDTDLAAWARGFVAATERLPNAWPAKSLRPADRAWLDAIAALARDHAPIPDRGGLAAWLADRAEITARPDV
jgi:yecA family protein